jgi:hypothetical protein
MASLITNAVILTHSPIENEWLSRADFKAVTIQLDIPIELEALSALGWQQKRRSPPPPENGQAARAVQSGSTG